MLLTIVMNFVLMVVFLKSWQWAFGQTPEFTYDLQNTFTWGNVVSYGPFSSLCSDLRPTQTTQITSKHGVILSCTFQVTDMDGSDISRQLREDLDALSKQLEGQKYGFLDDSLSPKLGPIRDVWTVLTRAMST